MADDKQCGRRNGRKMKSAPAGTRYGDRVLLEDAQQSHQLVLCRCKCGRESKTMHSSLMAGKCQRCYTCMAKMRDVYHGDSKRDSPNYRLYAIYKDANHRLTNHNAHEYHRYGGRGIRMCDEWSKSYIAFREWALANGYTDELTIDRIDNDGDYEPDNCRWVTLKEQNRNRSTNRRITAFGETKIMIEWLEDKRCTVGYHALYRRLKKGMDPELAITKPSRSRCMKPKTKDLSETTKGDELSQ